MKKYFQMIVLQIVRSNYRPMNYFSRCKHVKHSLWKQTNR